jgi:hypothetical protein
MEIGPSADLSSIGKLAAGVFQPLAGPKACFDVALANSFSGFCDTPEIILTGNAKNGKLQKESEASDVKITKRKYLKRVPAISLSEEKTFLFVPHMRGMHREISRTSFFLPG